MGTSGTIYAASGSSTQWTDPERVTISDDSASYAAVASGLKTEYLVGTFPSLNVPPDAQNIRVAIYVEIGASLPYYHLSDVELHDGTQQIGDNKGGSSETLPTTETVLTYGGEGDNWGAAAELTPELLNSGEFSTRIKCGGLIFPKTIGVDSLACQVWWDQVATPDDRSKASRVFDLVAQGRFESVRGDEIDVEVHKKTTYMPDYAQEIQPLMIASLEIETGKTGKKEWHKPIKSTAAKLTIHSDLTEKARSVIALLQGWNGDEPTDPPGSQDFMLLVRKNKELQFAGMIKPDFYEHRIAGRNAAFKITAVDFAALKDMPIGTMLVGVITPNVRQSFKNMIDTIGYPAELGLADTAEFAFAADDNQLSWAQVEMYRLYEKHDNPYELLEELCYTFHVEVMQSGGRFRVADRTARRSVRKNRDEARKETALFFHPGWKEVTYTVTGVAETIKNNLFEDWAQSAISLQPFPKGWGLSSGSEYSVSRTDETDYPEEYQGKLKLRNRMTSLQQTVAAYTMKDDELTVKIDAKIYSAGQLSRGGLVPRIVVAKLWSNEGYATQGTIAGGRKNQLVTTITDSIGEFQNTEKTIAGETYYENDIHVEVENPHQSSWPFTEDGFGFFTIGIGAYEFKSITGSETFAHIVFKSVEFLLSDADTKKQKYSKYIAKANRDVSGETLKIESAVSSTDHYNVGALQHGGNINVNNYGAFGRTGLSQPQAVALRYLGDAKRTMVGLDGVIYTPVKAHENIRMNDGVTGEREYVPYYVQTNLKNGRSKIKAIEKPAAMSAAERDAVQLSLTTN